MVPLTDGLGATYTGLSGADSGFVTLTGISIQSDQRSTKTFDSVARDRSYASADDNWTLRPGAWGRTRRPTATDAEGSCTDRFDRLLGRRSHHGLALAHDPSSQGRLPRLPLNAEGRKMADTWDPAKDEAAGEQCKS